MDVKNFTQAMRALDFGPKNQIYTPQKLTCPQKRD